MALVDYFLKLDGIDGESAADGHKGEIDVLSWAFGATQTGSFAYGGGGGTGKVNFQDFHFAQKMSKASPKLMLACATGEHIGKAVFVARKAGGTQEEYMKVTFTDCLVSSYTTSGQGEGDPIPTDSISLNFGKIEFEAKEQTAKGTMSGGTKIIYDVKAGKKG